MTPHHVDLSAYRTISFDRGAGLAKEALWGLVSLLLFRLCPIRLSRLKCCVLRAFGARVGVGVVIKPEVRITFPWKLEIGDHVWLGEECWLLNLERIVIGSNVCISQRAFLCTGSHNYKLPSFDLIVKPIVVADGAWIGASSWIGPGVTVGANAVLTACSVATKNLEPDGIYSGNQAMWIRQRIISHAGLTSDSSPPASSFHTCP